MIMTQIDCKVKVNLLSLPPTCVMSFMNVLFTLFYTFRLAYPALWYSLFGLACSQNIDSFQLILVSRVIFRQVRNHQFHSKSSLSLIFKARKRILFVRVSGKNCGDGFATRVPFELGLKNGPSKFVRHWIGNEDGSQCDVCCQLTFYCLKVEQLLNSLIPQNSIVQNRN